MCYNIQQIKYCAVIIQAASRDTTHNICKEMPCTKHALFKMYKLKFKHLKFAIFFNNTNVQSGLRDTEKCCHSLKTWDV